MTADAVDVAVVGAGPAGIAAAVAASEAGASVAVVDEYPAAGGQIWKGAPPRRWRAALADSGARLRLRTTVWAASDPHTLLTVDADGRPGSVRARTIVLATGAYDRPVAFPGWTLPGVLTAGAAQSLAKAHGVLPGQRVLLAGAGPFLLPVAAQLRSLGAEVVAVAEATRRRDWLRAGPRMLSHPARLRDYATYRLRLRGVPMLWGHVIVRASGAGRVESAAVAAVDGDWRPGAERALRVDAVCTAYGFLASLEIPRALGCAIGGGAVVHDERMCTSVPHVFVAGEAAGVGGAQLALLEGAIAGRAAAGAAVPRHLRRRRRHAARFASVLADLFAPRPGLGELADAATVLCRCEDVTAAEIDAAVARGARSPNALKIATRCGQGPCQGRVCGELVAARAPEADSFTVRPPLRPVSVATLIDGVTAGRA